MPQSIPASLIQVGRTSVLKSDVKLIVAEVDRGQNWKQNTVITSFRRYVSKADAATNAANFENWLKECPQAVAIRPDGSIKFPQLSTQSSDDPVRMLADALILVKREINRDIRRSLFQGSKSLFFGIAWIAAMAILNINRRQLDFHALVVGIVEIVAFLSIAMYTIRTVARRRRIINALSRMLAAGEIHTDSLTAAAMPVPKPYSDLSAMLALLGLLFACIPPLGLLPSVIALFMEYRKPSWVGRCAIIGTILGITGLAFVILVAITKQ